MHHRGLFTTCWFLLFSSDPLTSSLATSPLPSLPHRPPFSSSSPSLSTLPFLSLPRQSSLSILGESRRREGDCDGQHGPAVVRRATGAGRGCGEHTGGRIR